MALSAFAKLWLPCLPARPQGRRAKEPGVIEVALRILDSRRMLHEFKIYDFNVKMFQAFTQRLSWLRAKFDRGLGFVPG